MDGRKKSFREKMTGIRLIFVLFVFLNLVISIAFSHVPLTGEGHGLEDALEIRDPLKSWVIYTEYDNSRPLYYKFDLNSGDRLRAGLITVEKDFVPDLTIMGPGLVTEFDEGFHDEFEIPENYGLIHIHGEKQESKSFEPFTPTSYYYVCDVDFNVNETGTYYLIVDSATGGGKVGIVLGYLETFTLYEWIKVPFDVAFVHHWEGQNYLVIFFPMILAIFGGLLFQSYFGEKKLDASKLLALFGSLLYFGSSGIILVQMIIGLIGAEYDGLALVTPIFILFPALLGYSVYRKVWIDKLKTGKKIRLVIYSLLGFFFWAGYIVGPLLIIFSIFIPRND